MTMSGRRPKPYIGGGAMENDDEYQEWKRKAFAVLQPEETNMKSNSTMNIYGWSIEGWRATVLLYAVWLAPAGIVALFILRLKMTCG